MSEEDAKSIYDLFFLRLNPYINLFDPSLHTFQYVRGRSSFLFTTLLMAGSKYFLTKCYRECQELADDLAYTAFKNQWRSVEVVQAFSCLTYWKEASDSVCYFIHTLYYHD